MTCYALFASDQPLQVRYVGSTSCSINARLSQHLSECRLFLKTKRSMHPRMLWILRVQARGEKVCVRQLSQHRTELQLGLAEKRWIKFWGQFCDLTNGTDSTMRAVRALWAVNKLRGKRLVKLSYEE